MCGRYTLTRYMKDIAEIYGLHPPFEEFDEHPRFNIAPSQLVPVVLNDADGKRTLRHMRWGFTPAWSKDGKPGPINARSETAATNGMFRSAYKSRRCLIPADGFYEWQKIEGSKTKQPWYITLNYHHPFAFAGLWETWKGDGDPIDSCTILTTEPNAVMEPIHNRMPVIITSDSYSGWLGGDKPEALLKTYTANAMEAIKVGTWVNSPRHEDELTCPPQIGPDYDSVDGVIWARERQIRYGTRQAIHGGADHPQAA